MNEPNDGVVATILIVEAAGLFERLLAPDRGRLARVVI